MAERHSSSALDSHAARITQDMRRAIAAPLDRYVNRFARHGCRVGHDFNGRTPLRRRVKLEAKPGRKAGGELLGAGETVAKRKRKPPCKYTRLSDHDRKQIGRLRCEKGWTTRRVAHKFGVTAPTVIWWQREWERGRWG